MRLKTACTALAAVVTLMAPVAAEAAQAVVGTVTSSDGALVARDGHLIPATANMPLYQGDRVVTRAGGTANVAFDKCSVRVGASSMVPVGTQSCGKNSVVAMDSGRAGYAGTGSAFQSDNDNWIPWAVGAGLIGIGMCVGVFCTHDHDRIHLQAVSP